MSVASRVSLLSPMEKRQLLAQLLCEKAAQPKQYRLSFGQERLWFVDQLQPGLSVYNLASSMVFPGDVDASILQQCVDEIVRRHEVLRTGFSTVAGEPLQIVAPALDVPLAVVELRTMPLSTRAAEATRLMLREAQTPFDLTQPPLLRFCLLRLDASQAMLLFTMHHIVSDGWSLGILMRELAALHEAYANGRDSPLAPLPAQYGNFAEWQRQRLQGDRLAGLLSYWRRRLAELPALAELPKDRPRSPVQSFRGAWRSFRIPPTLCDSLRALSRQTDTTLYMILLAAVQLVLLRYSGQTDSVVGTPIANRTQNQHEVLIGLFANMLVIRTDLAGNPTFIDLLSRVREATLEAYAHQDLPFECLVEELQPTRHLGHHPLFQVMFAYQNIPVLPDLPSACEHDASQPVSGTTRFDLSLFMQDSGQALQATVEYSTDLFDHDRIGRMIDHLRTVLHAVAVDPRQRLWCVPLLPEWERQHIAAWNTTDAAFPFGPLLPYHFEHQAEAQPDAIAVVAGDTTCTYRALNQRANQLAHHLRSLGVGPETRVGICVERSIEIIVALLGILKAGAAYLPLDPGYPTDRMKFMLSDARAPVLLTQETIAAAFPPGDITIVRLDADAGLLSRQPEHNPAVAVTPDHAAYVIYTSGSSGVPKGVLVSHGALSNLLCAMLHELQPSPSDRLLAVTTLSFDIATLEVFLPLLVGAQLVIAGREATLDGRLLAATLRATGATIMQATPVSWRSLIEAGWQGDPQLKMITGGEPLPQDLADAMLRRSKFCWNLYGPTEATIYATGGRLTGIGLPVTIGRPIANMRTHLLDSYLNRVPIGVPGDLYLGGHGVARGYLNRPDLTAEKFIPDPFSREPGSRLYCTGDVAVYRADGTIEFLGRSDFQVKIRGFRIEPGEVEAVLLQHPAIRQAVVVAREDEPASRAGRYLAAYVIAQGDPLPISVLYDHLKGRLPDYMVPAAIFWLTEFPLTSNGKIDRKALPSPDWAQSGTEEDAVAPRNPVEQLVAAVWGEILGHEQIGVHDDFFALGGHSLLAARVMNRLSDLLQCDLPLLLLFQSSTVADLSRDLMNHPDHGPNVEAAAALLLQMNGISDAEAALMMDVTNEPAD